MTKYASITKMEELPDAEVPLNIAVGRSFYGYVTKAPKVGECFYVGRLRTSTVQEVVSPTIIRTLNSVYRITYLEDPNGE